MILLIMLSHTFNRFHDIDHALPNLLTFCEERMTIHRATADELEPLVSKRVGDSGGGQWRFQLMCKYCEDLGTVSAKKHSIGDTKHLKKAAEKFVCQGWWYDGLPICPTCYKRKGLSATIDAEQEAGGSRDNGND